MAKMTRMSLSKKQNEYGDGKKGESNDGGDELMEEDIGDKGKEGGITGEAAEDMEVDNNDEADGGKQTVLPRDGVSEATQADVSTSQKQPESRRDNDATTEDTPDDPQQDQPGDDMRGELGPVDKEISPNAD